MLYVSDNLGMAEIVESRVAKRVHTTESFMINADVYVTKSCFDYLCEQI